MKKLTIELFRSGSLVAILVCAGSVGSKAEPVPVRHLQGTIHAFLVLRSDKGRVIGSGEVTQVANSDKVTNHTVFHYKDGSIDDETTVFSQQRNFQLITDHHIQKGPSFKHPMDMLIDCRSGGVTSRSVGKDGKEQVESNHMDLPPDLGNGMVPVVLANISPDATGTVIPMVVATPKPRLVKLQVSSLGEQSFSVAGLTHKAIQFEMKIDLGGLPAVVAPLIGKQPPNIHAWITAGEGATFLREQGSGCMDCAVTTIELASPVWPEVVSTKAGTKAGN